MPDTSETLQRTEIVAWERDERDDRQLTVTFEDGTSLYLNVDQAARQLGIHAS